jgi:hypothetical protein
MPGKKGHKSRTGNPNWKKGVSANPEHQFKPGVSGNPGGRPSMKPYTDAHRLVASGTVKDLQVQGDDSVPLAVAKVAAREMLKGKIPAMEMVANRLEGKPLQGLRIEGAEGGPLQVEVEDQGLDEIKRRIAEVSARIRNRGRKS